jgi:RNA 2',3'-cyclic 3'-phosphodiesterase
MRLFVALRPPPRALAELEAAVAPLRADWPGLRWTQADLWHVTLAFLGEVAEPRLDELSVRLERAAGRHLGQRLAIGPGGAFPSPSRARVLIARISGGNGDQGALAALAASVAAAARRAGAPPPDEGRTYRPHLTLARCRQPADLSALVRALPGQTGEPWSPTGIHLIKSLGGPQPRYDTLGSWPLKR